MAQTSTKGAKAVKISDFDGFVDFAYQVFHGRLQLDDAVAQIANPASKIGVSERDMRDIIEMTHSSEQELPELAYVLASLNHAAARRLGGPPLQGRCTATLATVMSHRGELDQAVPLFEAALQLCRKAQDAEWEMICLGNLGNTYYGLKQLDRCMALYRQLIKIARRTKNFNMEGIAHTCIANVLRDQGKLDEALEEHRRGLDAYERA